jgi:succinate-acetate transporter protein
VATSSGGVAALVALLAGSDPGDAFGQWALVGLGAFFAWSVYSLLLLVGLWVRGQSPRSVRGVRPAADESFRAGPPDP